MGHKISKEQIDPGVKDHIMSFVGNKNELETSDKSDMVNAINSLIIDRVDNINNITKLADSIGNPVNASDNIDEVCDKVNGLLNTFKTNMMINGVTVESNDKFKQLIDKIATLADSEGKGIQYASGVYTTPSNSSNVEVNDLTFKPQIILLQYFNPGTKDIYSFILYNELTNPTTVYQYVKTSTSVEARPRELDGTNYYVKDNGFKIKGDILSTNYSITWYAIGVGEEDTTLRDSLASILRDEGVVITPEDNMAGLITKTDNEFTKKNTKAENARNKLANLMKDGGYEITGKEDIDKLLELLTISGINLREIKQMVSMYQHNFVLKNDGTLWSCGSNDYGQLGLGTSDTNSHSTFTQVTTNINNDVKEVVCGYYHTFILKNDGSIWSCGNNTYGELGLNVTSEKHVFTQVTTNINNDVKQIVCGRYYTYILKNDGSIWSCGDNSDGQLGLGDTTNRKTFTKVNIDNVKQIICSCNHTFILKNDGSVWSCGDNISSQLGLGDKTDKTTFTQVTTNINNDVKQIACGQGYTFILKNDGSIWSCGDNSDGQLGLGDRTDKTPFTQVTTNINNDVKEVVCGYDHTFILKNDGSVWSCGDNGNGQLGLGDKTVKTTFTKVTTNINNDVKEIVCGGYYTFILKNDGSVWACGYNSHGELGLGDNTYKTTFTQIPRGIY